MAEKGKKPSATVILIPKQLRAEWMDVMALDGMLSNFAFRLACVVGTYINNYSGSTFISQETVAAVMGVSERTVWGGFAELEKFGYLIVKRGTEALPADRKRRSGGQGVANVYVPAFDKSQISAGYRSDKFAKYCVLIWEKHLVKPQKPVTKYAKNCGPTLTSPSEKDSSRANGPSCPDGLGPFGAIISKRLGEATYRSWFATASIVSAAPDSVTLAVENKYKRDHIIAQFGAKLLDCCRTAKPSVSRIDVIVRQAV